MKAFKKNTGTYFYPLAILIMMMCISFNKINAQSMGISSSAITPDASSILEMRTTTKGMLIPRLTTTQRDAISLPAIGLMIYNSTTSNFNFYNGSSWIALASGSSGVSSVSGTTNRISIGGTAADPTIDISSGYVGQNSISTLGTIGTGTWNGTAIGIEYGGTGQTTQQAAINSLTGTQSSGTYLRSNGTNASLSAIQAADIPTLNQNTTGSAATLTTTRDIYGGSFNGSADVTNIIASTYGGTGNGFTNFSGPASTEKTFTLPNASATILTDNAAVTVAQGGTGATTLTGHLSGNGTSEFTASATIPGDDISGDISGKASGSLINVRTITSGTTYTPTSGTTKIVIEMVGGGGAGGGANANVNLSLGAGGGGGAGGYISQYITGISSATTYTIEIGAAGIGYSAAAGGDGGNTTFTTNASATPASTTFTAGGGTGGAFKAGSLVKESTAGGAGGTATNGDINGGGGSGGFTINRANAEYTISGNGGSSHFAAGGMNLLYIGTITNRSAAGNPGTGYGAGGGGGIASRSSTSQSKEGGDGVAGVIIIYEYK